LFYASSAANITKVYRNWILRVLRKRSSEGFITFLSKHIGGLSVPDYPTINRRVNNLGIDLEDSLIKSNGPVSIAVDSSGIKVHNGGDWIRKV